MRIYFFHEVYRLNLVNWQASAGLLLTFFCHKFDQNRVKRSLQQIWVNYTTEKI